MVSADLTLFVILAALFVIISNPWVYGLTDSLIGRPLRMPLQQNGAPTKFGYVIHGLVLAGLAHLYVSRA